MTMQALFSHEELSGMVLERIKCLLNEIDDAADKGHEQHLRHCRLELKMAKYQLMNPEAIFRREEQRPFSGPERRDMVPN